VDEPVQGHVWLNPLPAVEHQTVQSSVSLTPKALPDPLIETLRGRNSEAQLPSTCSH